MSTSKKMVVSNQIANCQPFVEAHRRKEKSLKIIRNYNYDQYFLPRGDDEQDGQGQGAENGDGDHHPDGHRFVRLAATIGD